MRANRTVDLWLLAVGLSDAQPALSAWLREEVGEPPPSTPIEALLPARYEARGTLGAGGMGEVHRVWDLLLEREVALKVVHPIIAASPDALARFHTEAKVLAGLEHPAVVPVHDLGVLQDGRPFFTMRVVSGATLAERIADVHAVSGDGWRASASGWNLERLVDAVALAGDALARAHERGLVHRDFKPQNVLVGPYGEALVVDWGLVSIGAARAEVVGTPAYMAPEQARGEAVGAAADAWALGATLYQILTGAPPWVGATPSVALALARAGLPPGGEQGTWLLDDRAPEELRAVVVSALRPAPEARPTAAQIVAALRDWRAGEARRARARAAVEEARQAATDAELYAVEARTRAVVAEAALAAIPSWAPVSDKLEAWRLEDAAEDARRRAAAADNAVDAALAAALTFDPEAVDAHAMRAARLRARHQVSGTDADLAALSQHVRALPRRDARRVELERYLTGQGAVTVIPEVDAEIEIRPWVLFERRLVLGDAVYAGRGPLRAFNLPAGRYLALIRAADRASVRLPLLVRRDEHADGAPPEGGSSFPIHLPAEGELGPEDIYVPAGWAWVGGDTIAPGSLPLARVWIEGFAMRRYPVRNREWLAFLDALWLGGRRDAAERFAPRERGAGTPGARIFGHDGERHRLVPDADGDVWQPDWPTIMVDQACAWAFARWEAERHGRPWRLPGELEWEKAARGADARPLPWGDHADPSWWSGSRSFQGRARIEAVDARPVDESPYGVCALAGHVVEWTADRFAPNGPPTPGGRVRVPAEDAEESWLDRTATWRVVGRGGSRVTDARFARAAFRTAIEPWARASNIGVRLAREVGPRSG